MSRPTRSTEAGRAYLDLQRRARAEGRPTQELLTLYVVERWLARLALSPYAEQFVLKGGILLAAFDARRPTADVDALARNFANDEATVVARIVAIAEQSILDDGVEYRTQTVTSRVIRDEDLYSGVRVAMDCAIASAVIKLRLDVNFGDPVTPAPQQVDLPALRPDHPPIRILGYPLETVLAEKITTAISLGPANTRVRDYADIYTLTGDRDISHSAARGALIATASYRGTNVVALSSVIGDLIELRRRSYYAYRAGLGPDGALLPEELATVVQAVLAFADRLTDAAKPTPTWNGSTRLWID
jgi:Nucleotidyl transferase AbiEii toxin, Type IV TA system